MGKDKKKDDDDDSGDDVYVVEAVINKRKTKEGKIEYLLKWQGFPLEESTWEPEENVACHELIAEFERKRSKSILEVQKMFIIFLFHTEKKETSATSSEKREEKQIHRIIGLTDTPGELHFLIKWKDHTADLVPAKEANIKYPQEVIRFYEERLKMQPH
ncbi:chromo shadow domain protein [Dictyocaulus viviparus]|uniref:Chromo shadow domain protein n=1 Tax=Dictyocaulus viviparus TaxID=29172 RepID=A0A0D8XII1_DICVI|nr:chromo shadow domain protein [Dictyocaulus viviparus]